MENIKKEKENPKSKVNQNGPKKDRKTKVKTELYLEISDWYAQKKCKKTFYP